jgi:hypothetical protein
MRETYWINTHLGSIVMSITAALIAGQLIAMPHVSVSWRASYTDGLLPTQSMLEEAVGRQSGNRVGSRIAQYCMPPQSDSDFNIFCRAK